MLYPRWYLSYDIIRTFIFSDVSSRSSISSRSWHDLD